MNCKKCGQEVDKKAIVCVHCGCKIKKPFYKKWWVWVLAVLIIIIIGSSAGNNDSPSVSNDPTTNTEQVVYEAVDLQKMFDELDENAMKAENNYKNKAIEFTCKIKTFDSDGTYITVEPVGADEWNFSSAMCYIKNETQKDFLLQKNVGDTVSIQGKIRSIGEVMGYSINIDTVS